MTAGHLLTASHVASSSSFEKAADSSAEALTIPVPIHRERSGSETSITANPIAKDDLIVELLDDTTPGMETHRAAMDMIQRCLPAGSKLASFRHLASLWAGYGHVYRVRASLPSLYSPVGSDADLHNTSSPTTPSSPTSYILKLISLRSVRSTPKPDDDGHLRKIVSYYVEHYFYKAVAPHLRSRFPHIKVPGTTPLDEARPSSAPRNIQHILLMEDLSSAYPVAPKTTLTFTQTKAVLHWLAHFHALYWEKSITPLYPPPQTLRQDPNWRVEFHPEGLWEQGGYSYLDTRRQELDDISDPEWVFIKELADVVNSKLKAGPQFHTLLHGDPKAENIFFTADEERCALFDFQYCGRGLGMRDVAYVLATSTASDLCEHREKELLKHYYDHLVALLPADHQYTWEVAMDHFEWALLDFVRHCAAWGFWGNIECVLLFLL